MEARLTLQSPNAETTRAIAAALAGFCAAGDCIALSGDLGAGKTEFARGFIRRCASGEETIPSPTFTLAQIYPSSQGAVWHFDLYRLKREEEARELGMDEAFAEGISLIEWPEKIARQLPEETLHVEIAQASGDNRTVTLHGAASRWREPLAALEQAHS